MSRPPSRASIIRAIVLKDLREFSRDRLWVIVAPLTLAMVIVVFWALPDTVDETITVGLYPPVLAKTAALLGALGTQGATRTQGVEILAFDTEEGLRAAVSGELEDEEAEKLLIGIAFPDDFVSAVRTGKKTTVSVYVDAAVPEEMRGAVSSAIREVAYGLRALATGKNPAQALPVTIPDLRTIVLGEDRAGDQVPMREKMRPMMAIMILMIEAMALAGLVAVEIQHRTVTALLVTPARTGDVLAAKGLTGTILGVSQALIFLLATKSFGGNWLLVTVLMLLGAVMMSAVGMIAGASGGDFMSTLFSSMILIIPLMIPGFAVLFPGSASLWVKALPSYGLIEAMIGSVGYGRGWGELAPHVGMTLAWDVVLFGAALLILKRKVENL